jgi:hypothetical protein
MHPPRRSLRAVSLLTAGLLVAAGATGCSGDDKSGDGDASASSSTSPSEGSTTYLPVPDDVALTPQGSDLELGESGVVAWQPAADKVGVLDLTVTAIQKISVERLSDWHLDAETRTSTPYFVQVIAKNVGKTNLADTVIPLYLADGEDSLVSTSTFESLFRPCPSRPLPSPFKPGDRTSLCLLYLLGKNGSLQGVSFFSGPGFDPITWNGQVTRPKPEHPDKQDDKSGKNDKQNSTKQDKQT